MITLRHSGRPWQECHAKTSVPLSGEISAPINNPAAKPFRDIAKARFTQGVKTPLRYAIERFDVFAKRATAMLFCLYMACLFGGGAKAEETDATNAPDAPIVVVDDAGGYWLYEYQGVRVEIIRKTDETIPLVWYEADLRCTAENPLRTALSAEKYPAKHLQKPDTIAKKQGLVYAQTDDFFGDRANSYSQKPGVVIRNGQLLYDSVYRKAGKAFPPLDALALFPDGTLECFGAGEYTGVQYLAMEATDVFSFGPILIRDGVMDARLGKGYADREPRSAIGMIAPWHYLGIVVEGRHSGSIGCGLKTIAEWMLACGVTEALNLDGGQTAAMIFQGRQLNLTGRYKRNTSVRSVSGVLGIAGVAAP